MILGLTSRNPKPLTNPLLTLNDVPLTIVTQYKYLGLVLTPTLTFDGHFRKSIGIVSAKQNTLSYLKHYASSQTLLLIYKTTILPLMEYAKIVYPLVPLPLRKKLQRLQNRALRIIYPSANSTQELESLHTISKLSTIEQRASRQLTLLMYRRTYNPYEYPLLVISGNTLSSDKIKFSLPRPRYERFKKFPL